MRVATFISLALVVSCFSGVYAQDMQAGLSAQRSEQIRILHTRSPSAFKRVYDFDIVQRTCAMYVAMHSAAFNSPVAFDRNIDDTMVHWNKCPGGTMVACAEPSPQGDTTKLGIPFPY